MGVTASRVHAHVGSWCACSWFSCISFRAPVHENDGLASTCGHCLGSQGRLVCAPCEPETGAQVVMFCCACAKL